MSVREVTRLKKEGKLKEAHDMALHELNEDANEWTCMSMFWVLRDLAINTYIPAHDMEKAQDCLNRMEHLLPKMLDNKGAGERAYQNLYKSVLPNADEVKAVSDLSQHNPNEAYNKITGLFGMDAKQLNVRFHENYGWIIYRYIKANSENLTSVQTRRLLRDYMQLENERPSLLHSMILNYALNFSKAHSDFNFYNFFMLWDAKNLRCEDYQKTLIDDHNVPSLVYRICRRILESCSDFDVSAFVAKFNRQDIVIESLRESFFWILMDLHKANKLEDLIYKFNYYAENFSIFGPSHWHSEILKIANRFMTDNFSSKFVPFVTRWDGSGNLREEDWRKETNDEGQEFPSLAVKSAKKFFDIVKSTPKDLVPDSALVWLKDMYEKIMQKYTDDDWSIRNYATICAWCDDVEEAIKLYKRLLINMGDKYYLWSELSNLLPKRNDLRIGLLLKAKKLEKNEDFLGDIHLSLASLWEEEGFSNIAIKELKEYEIHRRDKGWSVSDYFRELQAKISTCDNEPVHIDFNSYINIAEDYVYSDFEWTDFVIIDKWKSDNEERCKLYDGKETIINIKTKKFPILKKSKTGDVVQFKCYIKERQTNVHSWTNSKIKENKTAPLVARKTEKEPWSILPVKYGVIDYVNEKKKMLHIITQSSKQTFSQYKGEPLPTDSFVKFREYANKHTDEIRTYITDVLPCSSDEALQYMPTRVVAVDDVNYDKKLFHVVLGPGKVSDIVYFDQTDIRPSIGDFLRIVYCIKKNKEGKKRIKFLDIQPSDIECNGVTDTVEGRLEVKYRDGYYCPDENPDFAFIKDFYVHRKLLKKYNITKDCDVVAKIILGGDDKWKVYDLDLCK